MTDKIRPNDPRLQRKTANVRGKTYSYLDFTPATTPTDTVLLLHGFPDISLGWRYQIPALLALNLRVVVPDNLGYGRTDAPSDAAHYGTKSLADDMAELASAAIGKDVPFILGGHDWGAALAWRLALWHPQLVKAIFGVCVPYTAPRDDVPPLEDIIRAGVMPNFNYQLQLIGPDVEREIQGKQKIREFLSAVYAGWNEEGKRGFSVDKGVLFDRLPGMKLPRDIEEGEMEYYAGEFARNGMRGPTNWYRASKINREDELELVGKGPEALKIKVPTLFVAATKDLALPPGMAAGMDKWVDDLTKVEVNATHWLLWEAPEEFNGHLKAWLEKSVLGRAKAAL